MSKMAGAGAGAAAGAGIAAGVGIGGRTGLSPNQSTYPHSHLLGSPAVTYPGRSTTRRSPTPTTLFNNAPIPPSRPSSAQERTTSLYPSMAVHNPVPVPVSVPFSVPLAGDYSFLSLFSSLSFLLSPSFTLLFFLSFTLHSSLPNDM